MLNRRLLPAAVAVTVTLGLAAFAAATPANADSASPLSVVNTRVCANNLPGSADCLAIRHDLIDKATGKPVQMSAISGFGSTAIRTAYGITGTGAAGTVIAIVDAYDAPSAASDLAYYRKSMGLPPISTACTVSGTTIETGAGPCFVKVGQSGSTGSLPHPNKGWAQEIDLDLQMASTVCPECSILLVEANSSSMTNLNAAVATAASFTGVKAISNSYGGSDMSQGSAPAYNDAASKGIAVTASTGDKGYGDSFPASSTNVIAVGGTSLTVGSNGVRTSETAWSGAGSGCSTYNSNPGWEATSCGSMKANADVSAVADPNTGVSVYYNGAWYVFGGTSVSSPIIGSWLALNSANWSSSGNASQYVWSGGPAWYDVTSGSNGTCSGALCNAGTGWDGPTGLGSLPAAALPAGTSVTTLTAPSSASPNQPVTLSASVAPSSATGTVQFYDGTTAIGGPVTVASGSASLSYAFSSTGTHPVSAVYSGDSSVSGSTSNTVSVSVSSTSVPGVITTVTAATGSRKGTITASWSAPSDGGSAITGYLVTVYTGGGSQVAQGTVTNTNVTVSHLKSGRSYYVTVAAKNAIGLQQTVTQSNTTTAR